MISQYNQGAESFLSRLGHGRGPIYLSFAMQIMISAVSMPTLAQELPTNLSSTVKPEAAPDVATASVRKIPATPPPKAFADAQNLYRTGKYLLAQKAFEKFVKDGVADANTHYYLANCLYQRKQYTKALAQFDWVANHSANSLSLKNDAEATAYRLRSYKAGVCPGNCLKANDPRWQHMQVAGHAGTDLWIKFPYRGGSRSWNQNHIGEVIEYVNGMPENKGACPICGGTGRVAPLKDGV